MLPEKNVSCVNALKRPYSEFYDTCGSGEMTQRDRDRGSTVPPHPGYLQNGSLQYVRVINSAECGGRYSTAIPRHS